MSKMIEDLMGHLAALALSVVFAVAALFPLSALAEQPFAMDTGHRGGGSRTGDPLDTNDADDDGDSGDDPQDNNSHIGSRDDWGSLILRSSRVLLVPQYNGAILTFKIIVLPDASVSVERRDAK